MLSLSRTDSMPVLNDTHRLACAYTHSHSLTDVDALIVYALLSCTHSQPVCTSSHAHAPNHKLNHYSYSNNVTHTLASAYAHSLTDHSQTHCLCMLSRRDSLPVHDSTHRLACV